MALDYYEASLFDTLPVLYAEVAAAIESEYPEMKIPIADLPLLVSFGSWIGGDRDGNPFVTSQTTMDSLAMAQTLLLNHYRRRLQNVFEQLGSSTQQVPVSKELQELLDLYLTQLRTAGQTALEERFHFEYVRLLLACILMRLGATCVERGVYEAWAPTAEVDGRGDLVVRYPGSDGGGARGAP